jgi:deazaflavin-dependent oxidoreductase (nitroreductase family)
MTRLRQLIAGLFSRLMRTTFAHRFLLPLIPPLQLRLYRWTGGRFQLSALLMPSLVLTTIGATTGRRRDTPLACWPQRDGTWLVAGSNWGQANHPGWTANLIKHPEAEIVIARHQITVTAYLLDGAERTAAWPVLEAQFPGYRAYERQAGREIRIFRLVRR